MSKQHQTEFVNAKHHFDIVWTLVSQIHVLCYSLLQKMQKGHVAHIDFVFYIVSAAPAQTKKHASDPKIEKCGF